MRYGECIGTIRYLPMNRGLAPCDKLVRQHAISDELLEASWEVGRLVLAPQYRSGFDVLKRLLFLSLADVLDEHPVDNLLASCTPVLSRLYRRFGFSVLVKEACEDADGSYCLIHGRVPEVLRSLATNPEEKREVERVLALRQAQEALPC